jgi:RNA polymerase sigma factor (sigma-70 family)
MTLMRHPEGRMGGTAEDFDSWYKINFSRALSRAVMLTGDCDDAADITQEAFAGMYKSWADAGTWDEPSRQRMLKKVLHRRYVDWVRQRVSQRGVISAWSRQHVAFVLCIEEHVINRILARGGHAAAALALLSPMERAVFMLTVVDELSSGEVAKIVGITPSSVRTHYQRAKAKMMKYRREHPDCGEGEG